MKSKFLHIQWQDKTKSLIVNDYLLQDNEFFLLSQIIKTVPKYEFVMTRNLARNLNEALEDAIHYIGSKELKIINLSLDADGDFVSGSFEVAEKLPKDI